MAPYASDPCLWWLRRHGPPLWPLLSDSRHTYSHFPTYPITVHHHGHHLASVAHHAHAVSTSPPHTTLHQMHDLNISGLMLHPLDHLLVSGSDDNMIASGHLSDLAMHPLFLPQVEPSPWELGSVGCSEASLTMWVVHTAE